MLEREEFFMKKYFIYFKKLLDKIFEHNESIGLCSLDNTKVSSDINFILPEKDTKIYDIYG